MNLVIVDIDGTLTQTNDIDAECYVRAVSAFLGRSFAPDWVAFSNVTDSGILDELCRESLGRTPTTDEVEFVRNLFVSELQQASRERPHEFGPIPGATEFIQRCPAAGWHVALATGGWARSAKVKLEAAGLPTDTALASANDSNERIGIVGQAIRCAAESGVIADKVVLVGDALWDLETAQRLHMPFIGIATGNRAEQLRSAGATHVFPDFLDLRSIFTALGEAGAPPADPRPR